MFTCRARWAEQKPTWWQFVCSKALSPATSCRTLGQDTGSLGKLSSMYGPLSYDVGLPLSPAQAMAFSVAFPAWTQPCNASRLTSVQQRPPTTHILQDAFKLSEQALDEHRNASSWLKPPVPVASSLRVDAAHLDLHFLPCPRSLLHHRLKTMHPQLQAVPCWWTKTAPALLQATETVPLQRKPRRACRQLMATLLPTRIKRS